MCEENECGNMNEMLNLAKKYVENCYAPYSKIHVVAVLSTDKGLYVGVNVENASYGLTVCAERVAVFKAISEGAKKFHKILIYSPDVYPMPCGACRQVLSEFVDDDFEVIVVGGKEQKIKRLSFSEVLPYRFKIDKNM